MEPLTYNIGFTKNDTRLTLQQCVIMLFTHMYCTLSKINSTIILFSYIFIRSNHPD